MLKQYYKKYIAGNEREILKVLIALALGLFLGLFPTAYYCVAPGSITSLDAVVHVDDTVSTNAIGMTTVTIYPGKIPILLFGHLAPHIEVKHQANVIPKGWTEKEYNQYTKDLMAESHVNAKLAAANYAGLKYDYSPGAPHILKVVESGPSHNILQSNDIIRSIAGVEIRSREELRTELAKKSPDETIEVGVERNGELVLNEIKLSAKADGSAYLGIYLINRDMKVDFPDHKIEIRTGNVSGPSAGSMMTIEILQRLGYVEIAEGLRIAGTGTISSDGTVGNIGSINQKLFTAHLRGINLYFMPTGNWAEVNLSPSELEGMEVVCVDNIEQIIDYIHQYKTKTK